MRGDGLPSVMDSPRYVLTASCPDRVGIVAAFSSFLAGHGGWIVEASQHADPVSSWFFMRYEVLADSLPLDADVFRTHCVELASQFQMNLRIHDTRQRKRVMILVSKQDHCLADLLHRWRSREMDFDLVAVVSNHDDLRSFVEWHGVAYHYVPMPAGEDKTPGFEKIDTLFREYQADTMVLARYMQILPTELCERWGGRIINIHHSFLPSFVGAKPYHQAYDRGVKLIGATCHYVTSELDAGPIIEQDVVRIDHTDTVEDMVRLGRDVERTVLARGLRYHLQDRVLVHANKAVVFT